MSIEHAAAAAAAASVLFPITVVYTIHFAAARAEAFLKRSPVRNSR